MTRCEVSEPLLVYMRSDRPHLRRTYTLGISRLILRRVCETQEAPMQAQTLADGAAPSTGRITIVTCTCFG
jgi:hypothetical protein